MSVQLCNVQQKISCCFETLVLEETSSKRPGQGYKVVAGDKMRTCALDAAILSARASEKLDGTCCYVAEHRGVPWLWARHDRKPNKAADKRFKKHQTAKRLREIRDEAPETTDEFVWDVVRDFRETPDDWIPADGVPISDGLPQPDKAGHIPGWVPVDTHSRQHCWHLTTVDLDRGLALVLQPKSQDGFSGHGDSSDTPELEIVSRPLSDFMNCTFELIGTCINANPYNLGTKQSPLHVLVRHGAVTFNSNPPPLDHTNLKEWFMKEGEGQVEGIVWHCCNGEMYKLHRHHLGLKWPVESPRLLSIPVTVSVSNNDHGATQKGSFFSIANVDGERFDGLNRISCTGNNV